jgi:hypothetical protein
LEFGNEPPPKVAANAGVGEHNLLTVPGEHEGEVHVADCVALQSVGEVEEEERLNMLCRCVVESGNDCEFLKTKEHEHEGGVTHVFIKELGVGTGEVRERWASGATRY